MFDECSRLWEVPATPYKDLKTYEAGIVLGGMSVYDPSLDRAQFFRGVDRLIQAVELYKNGVIKKIIFTGGSGRLLHPEMKEGNYINRYLLYMGVPESDFTIEAESKNTYENAVFTKQSLNENSKNDFLLITSSMHMRRSLGCFNKAGLNVQPYSTDRYAGPRKFEFDHLFIPEPSVLYDWTKLLHEMVGYITYKIAGYL
ncbi:MAG: YdcF family protein [Bacteroidia bacterium]